MYFSNLVGATPVARPGRNSQLYCILHQGDPPGAPLQKW